MIFPLFTLNANDYKQCYLEPCPHLPFYFPAMNLRLLLHLLPLLLLVLWGKALDGATAAEPLRPALAALEAAASSSEVPALRNALAGFTAAWPAVEDGVRAADRTAYLAIEAAMGDLGYQLEPDNLDPAAAAAAARELVAVSQPLLVNPPAAVAVVAPAALALPTTANPTTLSGVLDLVRLTQQQVSAGQIGEARATFSRVRQAWPDVESEVKTRDATAYRACEELLARCAAQLTAGDVQAAAALSALAARMSPYTVASAYGPADAFLLLLREGIEALLVITALLTFLARSGHADKRRWIWLGAGAGVGVSLALAFAINLLFKAAFSGADRELVEGLVGLAAAGLLFWVSWWLHRAASMSRWNAQIADRTQAALAGGSLASLTMLAFLAVLREGAETALFLLGMAPSITTGDLLLGLALGGVALAFIGVVFVTLGARLPLRPFFAGLGILILAMGVKFVGAGLHALQIAQWLPSSVIPGLPTVDALGFHPTWESALGQLLAIILASGLLTWGSRQARNSRGGRTAGGAANTDRVLT